MGKISPDNLKCKVCGSLLTVRDGKIKGVQRWECKACGSKFLDNDARYGMKTPIEQVTAAIQMYYEGLSLSAICRQMQLRHNNYPSVSTVYEWVVKYSRQIATATRNHHPAVGDVWLVDETYLTLQGEQVRVWDVVDRDTCFILTSLVSTDPERRESFLLMERAIEKAGKVPGVIITEHLAENLAGLNYPSTIKKSKYELTPFHNILESRTRLLSDLKRLDTIVEFLSGWLIYYNYYRPHELLDGKTPAVVSNVVYNRENVANLVYQRT